MPTAPALSPLALALGRVPSGLYIVATSSPEGPAGFLGSFVQQVAFDPPAVCVAVARERAQLAALRASGRFAVSILERGSNALVGRFVRRPPPGTTPFDGLELRATGAGDPVLADALAWLSCRLSGEQAIGDHVVLFGTVVEGALAREGEPAVHVRRNGLAY
jgi:flavin reductase (DIM6/NTAB) family NADH-FMN oxidoreductase RutF